jgi:hypothetical protein
MTDELEARLRSLGNSRVPTMDGTRVEAIERQLLAGRRTGRASFVVAVAAACVVLALAVSLAVRDDEQRSLQPSNPSQTTAGTAQPPLGSASTVTQSTPPTSASETTTSPVSSVPATPPPTATTDIPTTTSTPETIPSSSFALSVERIGSELRFSWPRYASDRPAHYQLIAVDAEGLTSWPVDASRVAVTTADLVDNSATLALRRNDGRRWVVAVVSDSNRLIAISTIATSD